MQGITYSEARRGDEPALAAFHRFSDPSVFTREYWSYRADQSVFAVGKDGDRIVASVAMIPYEMSVCGERMLTGRCERTLVDPAYRGKGLWQNVMDFCAARGRERGMRFVWGGTGARRAFEKVGFTFLSGHRLHLYALASVRGVQTQFVQMAARGDFAPARVRERIRQRNPQYLEEYAILAASLPSLLVRALTKAPLSLLGNPYTIEREPRSYADIEALYERLGVRQHDIYLPQDESFFRWMLASSRLDVSRYFAYDGDRLAGYVYVARTDSRISTIIDFAFENARVTSLLLERARGEARARGSAFLKISINLRHRVQAGYLPAALANGFVPLYRRGSHVVMPLQYTTTSVLNDMARWYLTDLCYVL